MQQQGFHGRHALEQRVLQRLRQVRELSGGKVPSQAEMANAEAALTRAVAAPRPRAAARTWAVLRAEGRWIVGALLPLA